jgi:UDP-3-O-[3-hydroxymyristoyl] glucosamine N-acyltransferase
MGSTIIRKGVKDNQIQVGHNVEIGRTPVLLNWRCRLTKIGKNGMIGGQVGIADI